MISEAKMEKENVKKALEELDREFSKETLDWLIRMYDGKSGGFYYAQSSIDNEQFEPDIESTTQVLSLLDNLGLFECPERGVTNLPEWFKDGIYNFLAKRQDEGDGYFYDPVYRLTANKAKKERNTVFVTTCLDYYIPRKTPYPTPMQRLKSDAAKKSTTDSDQSMYATKESFLNWLEEIVKKHPDSYHWGSDICSGRAMITATGHLHHCVEWLKERQNKENGTWEKVFDTTAVNGVLKICGYFNKNTEPFPNYEIYIKNLVEFTKTFVPGSAASAWNPLGSLKVILENLTEAPSPEIQETIDSGIAKMISNTTEKMREFRQPDVGFGYGRQGSSKFSNDVQVSLGLPEGDVNALSLMTLIYRDAYRISGIKSSKVWKKYYDYFFEEIKKKYDKYHI